jgi:molecular chaperone IbpA|tara:strand:- start:2910 stop:3359 length:450 start_codon:yes stop_codon:yes gene_type:complete
MTNQAISIFNQLRPISVGYDDIFDNFQSMFNHQYDSISQPNYPPYNIVKTDKYKYDIQVALAGYSKKDVDVSFENSVLTIKSLKDKDTKEVEENNGVLHKGIAKRMFTKSFTIAEDVEIKGAELKDGLLVVSMERIIPDHKKARTITIK